ncbi:unnamed protein product [Blepharisma stoltei]|uniref:F-box domain-containing protein n=1 Tax=Blepharisma stoltei TaxID=1481888 RepID=A0AAU9IZ26_9CILI|nr:unnamed protein product [Blepharisma stoltei]
MSIDVIPSVIEKLKYFADTDHILKTLSTDLEEKEKYISKLEDELKQEKIPKKILDYIHKIRKRNSELQERTEELELINDEMRSELEVLKQKQKEMQEIEKVMIDHNQFFEVVSKEKIWDNLKLYFGASEFCALMQINKRFHSVLSKDRSIWNQISNDIIKQTSVIPIPIDPIQIYFSPEDKEEIKLLIGKFVAQEYVIGKPFEEKLLNATKTLLTLKKQTEIATSSQGQQEKFSSVEELISNTFQIDKTVMLLNKGAALLASNPQKMGEYINFMQTSFAGLLLEGARLLIDAKQIEKLKNFFVVKIRETKAKLLSSEHSRDSLEVALNAQLDIKGSLVKRLHDLDMNYTKKVSDLAFLKQTLKQLEVEKLQLKKNLELSSKEFEENRHILANEIFKLREKLDVATAQKKELIEAFEDFGKMFYSLGLE